MANIFYSMAGEGRGHATRVKAMVQMLKREHEIVLFASNDSYQMLQPLYQNDASIRLVEIPGLRFQYTADKRIDYLRTGHHTSQFILELPGLLENLTAVFETEQPDLVISDFEPLVPRAAARFDVPVVSLDHQHFLVTNDLSGLPTFLQAQGLFMGLCVEAYFTHQVHTIVSSFFAPPLKARYLQTTQVGVLLREAFFHMTPWHGDFVLVYWRKHAYPQVLEALQGLGREVRIYGLGEQPDVGNLRFFPIEQQRFLDDLAGCQALISTAGNQLVGEALFFGKPVFAIPEAGNYEQYINAHFLQQSGMGAQGETHTVTAARLRQFLDQLDTYREYIDPDRVCGNRRALQTVSRYLPSPKIALPETPLPELDDLVSDSR